jgi:hypothetical protein
MAAIMCCVKVRERFDGIGGGNEPIALIMCKGRGLKADHLNTPGY